MSESKTEDTKLIGVLSDEEIDLYLQGDRRGIDKLLLTNSNRLTALVLSHMKCEDERNAKEDVIWKQIEGIDAIKLRAEFVDTLILAQQKRNAMMDKVTTSNVIWASVTFLGYTLWVLREAIVAYLQTKIGS